MILKLHISYSLMNNWIFLDEWEKIIFTQSCKHYGDGFVNYKSLFKMI